MEKVKVLLGVLPNAQQFKLPVLEVPEVNDVPGKTAVMRAVS